MCRSVSNGDDDNEIQSSIMDGDASCDAFSPIKGGGEGGVDEHTELLTNWVFFLLLKSTLPLEWAGKHTSL